MVLVCLHMIKKEAQCKLGSGKAAGDKTQDRTWDSRMTPGRQIEVGEGDGEKHAAQEDKQKRKHKEKPEGRGKR